MLKRGDPHLCSIQVTGSELVELKRHAHKIPECPGLDRRIQRYNGKGSLKLSHDELDWLVAVLDAVPPISERPQTEPRFPRGPCIIPP